jgi:hypothetical protein
VFRTRMAPRHGSLVSFSLPKSSSRSKVFLDHEDSKEKYDKFKLL